MTKPPHPRAPPSPPLTPASLGGGRLRWQVMEHHSNLVPWQLLARQRNVTIRYARLREDETLDLDHLRSLLSERTRLVALAHVSNTLGCVNPIAEVRRPSLLTSPCPSSRTHEVPRGR